MASARIAEYCHAQGLACARRRDELTLAIADLVPVLNARLERIEVRGTDIVLSFNC
jgi:hypothetical protein